MSKVNHDIRSNQGRTIYMPEYYEGENGWGNLVLPNVYSADDYPTLYPRGTRLVEGERSFYYGTYRGKADTTASAYTVTATDGDDLAFKFLFSVAYNQAYATGKLVRKIAGEIDVAVVDTVDDGGRADNWYSGGWISGKDSTPADERMFSRRIEGHSFSATGSKTQKFWHVANESNTIVDLSASSNVSVLRLDQPVINSKTTMAFKVHTNEWKHAIWQSDTGYHMNASPLGACMHNDPVAAAATQRGVWMQTYGQMFCPHLHTANFPGTASNDCTLVVMADGSFSNRNTSDTDYHITGTFFPVVGRVLGSTTFEAAGQVADSLPMIYLLWKK